MHFSKEGFDILTEGFVRKKYNKLYISTFLCWTVYLFGTLCDSVLGGRYISEDAVSATGLVQPIMSLVLFLSNLLAVGSANKFENYAGAFDKKRSSTAAGLGMLLSVGIGIVFSVMMLLLRELFFMLFPVGEEIGRMAREYYNVFALLVLVSPTYYTLYYLVSIDGDNARALCCDIIQTGSNLVLSIVLVQRWGVRGLAYGTLFATLLGTIPLLMHFRSKYNSIFFAFRWDGRIVKEILISGSTDSVIMLYVAVINIFMNKYVLDHFGDAFLAAYAVVNLILNLGEITSCAVDGAAPFICVSSGEKNWKELRRILNLCTKRTLLSGCILAAVFTLGAKYVPGIYGITTPEIKEASVYAVRVLAVAYVATGFVYEWSRFLPKINKALTSHIISFVYMMVAPLIFPVWFGNLWGFRGLVWGFFVTPFAALLVGAGYLYLRYGRKSFPYAIEESDSIIFSHEFAVNDAEIVQLRDVLREEMHSAGLSDSLAVKIELVLEETLQIVAEKNKGKKQILGNCSLIITKDTVNLITCDNGVLFDIIEEAETDSSLRHYVVARMIDSSKESAYMLTISFNRNSFLWER